MRRLKVDVDKPARKAITAAVRVFRRGGLVAFPTETVYGLGTDAANPEAVRKLFAAKGRDAAKACAFLVHNRAAAERLTGGLPPLAQRLADRFWPGPLTLVVPDATGRLVGLRLPSLALPRRLAKAAGRPLIQTSANLSGQPAALNAAAVAETFGNGIDLLLDGGRTEGGASSTVVQCDARAFTILRAGAIHPADIIRAATHLILFACTGNLCRSPVAEALCRRALARRLGCEPEDVVRHGFRVGSFGTMAMAGHRASEHSITVAAEMGLDLSAHRSRPFAIGALKEADRVYCMSSGHREFLQPYFTEREGVLQLLHPGGRQIHDPYGRSLRVYRKTSEQIAEAVEARVGELLAAEEGEEKAGT